MKTQLEVSRLTSYTNTIYHFPSNKLKACFHWDLTIMQSTLGVQNLKKSLNLHSINLLPHIFHFLSPLPACLSLLSLPVSEPTWQSNPLTVADNACWPSQLAATVDWMKRSAAMSVR